MEGHRHESRRVKEEGENASEDRYYPIIPLLTLPPPYFNGQYLAVRTPYYIQILGDSNVCREEYIVNFGRFTFFCRHC